MAETWDESKPAGGRSPTLGDDDVREFKRAERERQAEDHIREAVESPAFGAPGGYKIGKHKYVTLVEQATAKTTADDEVALRCADVSGSKEIMIRPPSAGTERQFTKNAGANINLNSGDFSSRIIPIYSLDTGAVDTDALAADSVTTAKILNGNVTSPKIGTGAVLATNISAGAVTNIKLGALAVSADKIAPNSVGMTQISDYMPFGINDANLHSITNESWHNLLVTGCYCPYYPESIYIYARARYVTGAGTALYLRAVVNGVTGSIITYNTTALTWKALGAWDLGALSPADFFEIVIQAAAGNSCTCELQGVFGFKGQI